VENSIGAALAMFVALRPHALTERLQANDDWPLGDVTVTQTA